MQQPSQDDPRPPCRVVGIPCLKTKKQCNIPGDLPPPPAGWGGERPGCYFRSPRMFKTCSQRQLVTFHCWPIHTVRTRAEAAPVPSPAWLPGRR